MDVFSRQENVKATLVCIILKEFLNKELLGQILEN